MSKRVGAGTSSVSGNPRGKKGLQSGAGGSKRPKTLTKK